MESGSSKARPLRQNPSKTGAPEEITVSIPPLNPRSYYHESDEEEDRAFRPALPSLRRRTDEADSSRGRRRRSGLGSHRTEETGEERGGAGVGVVTTREGQEEASQPPRCHRTPKQPWSPRGRCHRGVSREEGGTADGACPPVVRDDA